ncbi:MAG: hypothetical protein E7D52_04210 [Peptoniphilus harei]|nr:hypothetical protein [Peptoniphilus harei]MDU2373736.1 hypothetical protein [Peptoniphilus harei]
MYLGVKEIARLWNISERRVRVLCSEERVERLDEYIKILEFK